MKNFKLIPNILFPILFFSIAVQPVSASDIDFSIKIITPDGKERIIKSIYDIGGKKVRIPLGSDFEIQFDKKQLRCRTDIVYEIQGRDNKEFTEFDAGSAGMLTPDMYKEGNYKIRVTQYRDDWNRWCKTFWEDDANAISFDIEVLPDTIKATTKSKVVAKNLLPKRRYKK